MNDRPSAAPGTGAPPPPPPVAQRVILVSGFAPFQGGRTNPSLEVAAQCVRHLQGRGGGVAIPVQLEVLWDRDQETVSRLIGSARNAFPGAVVEWLAFGQGPAFTLETVARNARRPLEDNAGCIPGTGATPLENEPGGPPQCLTPAADNDRVRRIMTRHAVSLQCSTDAGAYLCESLLYTLLRHVGHGHLQGARFFHLPSAENLVPDSPEAQQLLAERERFVAAVIEVMG